MQARCGSWSKRPQAVLPRYLPDGSDNSRLTFPNDPVPSVRSIIYCPIRGLAAVLEDEALPAVLVRWPGRGGAGRVAIVRGAGSGTLAQWKGRE